MSMSVKMAQAARVAAWKAYDDFREKHPPCHRSIEQSAVLRRLFDEASWASYRHESAVFWSEYEKPRELRRA